MNSLPKRRVALPLVIATAALLLFAGCAPGATPEEPTEEPEEDKEPIMLVDANWESLWINNAIAGFIIERGFGYPVQVRSMSGPVLEAAIEGGDAHVHMEYWHMQVDYWEDALGDTVLELGPIMESSVQGWYVPDFVIEGDEERDIEPMAPGLESVHDLDEYTDVFASDVDPDRGVLVTGIADWPDVTRINEAKLHVYGLADDYITEEPGSGAALDSAIAGAYERGEPVLAYYWEPTWIMGAYDMVRLEEPEYDEEVWEHMVEVSDGDIPPEEAEKACAYPDYPILKAAHAGLQDRAPEVVDFLDGMLVGTETINEIAAYMELEDKDPEEGAMWFFENHEDKWRNWLPDEVEEKVAEALREEGLDISE